MQENSTTKSPHLPDDFAKVARVDLALLPTPLHEATRLSQALGGPRIFLKRDDLTGLGGGGNKTRKLEFLIAQALEQKADCIVTAGGTQSNHCRQTAAAAARYGLECHSVFGANPPSVVQGNYYLDELLGAKFYWTEKSLRNKKMKEVASYLRTSGKSPYIIPVGGSNDIGAMGYAAAMFEIQEQIKAIGINIDHIIFATSSGGTQAGLMLGSYLTKFQGKVIGISIDQAPDEQSNTKYRSFIRDITNSAADMLNINHMFTLEDININYDYLGQGYGVVGNLERVAVKLLARTEGILMGPVYPGRALGGLIDLIHKNKFDKKDNILFMHTGDDHTLHAYNNDLI